MAQRQLGRLNFERIRYTSALKQEIVCFCPDNWKIGCSRTKEPRLLPTNLDTLLTFPGSFTNVLFSLFFSQQFLDFHSLLIHILRPHIHIWPLFRRRCRFPSPRVGMGRAITPNRRKWPTAPRTIKPATARTGRGRFGVRGRRSPLFSCISWSGRSRRLNIPTCSPEKIWPCGWN